ncbi:MAG TPA: CaiB/BaiF CoA-transferase family protein [Candidatus Thermoplasmatota archaeon]|nr:CaiB/BaiF CoA-transferase family protein [Candidatus Thermoplasmatota archaeon]
MHVLDLSRLLPGPFLTSLLADLGADVVKVEPPGVGDEARLLPYAFDAVNRGKRSLVVDLKSPRGAEVVLRLAARSDVLVESFRPGVLERLGVGDAALAAANPRLVRCALVGHPPGPYRDDVGHDLNYQALAGILSLSPTSPAPPSQTADLGGALYAATGILAALYERERTGRGARIEVALADAALAFNVLPLARAAAHAEENGVWELSGSAPCYRLYRCADGRQVALGALEPRFFARFAQATGAREELQFDASPEAHAEMEALFSKRTAAEWVATLRAAGVPATPVLAPAEVGVLPCAAHPLARPPRAAAPAPELGEHTEAILREAGFGDDEVRALRAARAVE